METSSTIESFNSQFRHQLPEMPEDIIIDILLKLPVESLLRFKLVCKTWYNLFKSPRFVSMHQKAGTVSQLVMYTSNVPGEDEAHHHVFSFLSNDKSTRVLSPDLDIPATQDPVVFIVGSCNGIICYFDDSSAIFLSNPATREFRQLAPTSIKSDLELRQMGVGFGSASPNICDLKVLRLFSVPSKSRYVKANPKYIRAEIFTLSTNTWKQIEWGLDKKLRIAMHSWGCFCATSVHFIVRDLASMEHNILCCDLHTERFRTMNFPSKDHGVGGYIISLMVVKELLSGVYSDPRMQGKDSWIEIWSMKDYGVEESWSKLYRIGPPVGIARSICCWMDDQALLLMEERMHKLVTCNLDTLDLEYIKIDADVYNPYSSFVVHKESLISIM